MDWLAYAEAHGDSTTRRPGKRVALFEVRETRTFASYDAPCVICIYFAMIAVLQMNLLRY